MPGGGRRDGDRAAPGRAGRHRDRQVAGLHRPGRRLGQEGGGGHGHQGPAGPAGREGPADGGRRTGRRVLLRRAEGSQQLPLPSAGGRGRRPRLPAAVRRRRVDGPGTGRHRTAGHTLPETRHAAGHSCRTRPTPPGTAAEPDTPAAATRGWSITCGGCCAGPRTAETGDRADLDFEPHPRAWAMVSVGARECPGAFRCPSGNRASPSGPGPGPPRPTWWWSTPTSTAPTWPAGAPSCPSTTWWSSTRPTRWRRS